MFSADPPRHDTNIAGPQRPETVIGQLQKQQLIEAFVNTGLNYSALTKHLVALWIVARGEFVIVDVFTQRFWQGQPSLITASCRMFHGVTCEVLSSAQSNGIEASCFGCKPAELLIQPLG